MHDCCFLLLTAWLAYARWDSGALKETWAAGSSPRPPHTGKDFCKRAMGSSRPGQPLASVPLRLKNIICIRSSPNTLEQPRASAGALSENDRALPWAVNSQGPC